MEFHDLSANLLTHAMREEDQRIQWNERKSSISLRSAMITFFSGPNIYASYGNVRARKRTTSSTGIPGFTTSRYITEYFRYIPGLLRGRRASRNHNKDPNRIIGWINIPFELFGFSLFGRVNKHFMRVALNTVLKSPNLKVAIAASAFWEPFISKDDFDLICYDYLDLWDWLARTLT